MISKAISYRNPNKNYFNVVKEFNNENHFSNWYKAMNKKGYKIIGVEPITD